VIAQAFHVEAVVIDAFDLNYGDGVAFVEKVADGAACY
jgi:hypothetical protein